ncbi:hypothetical protein BDZ91DRAFT_734400, partial [Kalaharituber pfeilii]
MMVGRGGVSSCVATVPVMGRDAVTGLSSGGREKFIRVRGTDMSPTRIFALLGGLRWCEVLVVFTTGDGAWGVCGEDRDVVPVDEAEYVESTD